MIGTIADKILGWLSDPSAFWLVYGTILFCAFLLLVGTVENLILRKPINAFLMGILFAVFVYFGIHWGKSIAPTGSVHVWHFGEEPTSEGTCPASTPIKAVLRRSEASRCTYYLPNAEFYNQTKPDRCYLRVEQAKADGCEHSNF